MVKNFLITFFILFMISLFILQIPHKEIIFLKEWLTVILLVIIPPIAATIFIIKITNNPKIVIPISLLSILIMFFMYHWLIIEKGNLGYTIFFFVLMLMGPAETVLPIMGLICYSVWKKNQTLNNPLQKYPFWLVFLISSLLIYFCAIIGFGIFLP